MACNSKYSKDNHKLFDIAIDSGGGCAGAGSLENDKITFCKICDKIGYPHEPIIFRKVVIEKWLPFNYFRPYEKHEHKTKNTNIKKV